MTITTNKENNTLTICVAGRLDTTTAPDLDKTVDSELEEIKDLVFDFKDLEYISSAGIRVILKAMKIMNEQGSMKLINVNDDVMEVLDITGFVDILNIE